MHLKIGISHSFGKECVISDIQTNNSLYEHNCQSVLSSAATCDLWVYLYLFQQLILHLPVMYVCDLSKAERVQWLVVMMDWVMVTAAVSIGDHNCETHTISSPVCCRPPPEPCKTPVRWSSPDRWRDPPPHSSSRSALGLVSGLEMFEEKNMAKLSGRVSLTVYSDIEGLMGLIIEENVPFLVHIYSFIHKYIDNGILLFSSLAYFIIHTYYCFLLSFKINSISKINSEAFFIYIYYKYLTFVTKSKSCGETNVQKQGKKTEHRKI